MKQFWTPMSVHDFLCAKFAPGGELTNFLPKSVYCTENFLWAELLVHQREVPTLLILENLFGVANRLQALRDTVFQGNPVSISSAWRSASYNKKIGGAVMSKHVLGQAVDFVVQGLPPAKVQILLSGFSGGLGAYQAFTHIDISNKRRWLGAE